MDPDSSVPVARAGQAEQRPVTVHSNGQGVNSRRAWTVRSRCCKRLLEAVALGEKLIVREHDELLVDHRSGILAEVIALPRT